MMSAVHCPQRWVGCSRDVLAAASHTSPQARARLHGGASSTPCRQSDQDQDRPKGGPDDRGYAHDVDREPDDEGQRLPTRARRGRRIVVSQSRPGRIKTRSASRAKRRARPVSLGAAVGTAHGRTVKQTVTRPTNGGQVRFSNPLEPT
jgi:hypothetical protein